VSTYLPELPNQQCNIVIKTQERPSTTPDLNLTEFKWRNERKLLCLRRFNQTSSRWFLCFILLDNVALALEIETSRSQIRHFRANQSSAFSCSSSVVFSPQMRHDRAYYSPNLYISVHLTYLFLSGSRPIWLMCRTRLLMLSEILSPTFLPVQDS
jgi:hypothetical protein